MKACVAAIVGGVVGFFYGLLSHAVMNEQSWQKWKSEAVAKGYAELVHINNSTLVEFRWKENK